MQKFWSLLNKGEDVLHFQHIMKKDFKSLIIIKKGFKIVTNGVKNVTFY